MASEALNYIHNIIIFFKYEIYLRWCCKVDGGLGPVPLQVVAVEKAQTVCRNAGGVKGQAAGERGTVTGRSAYKHIV